MGSRLEKALDEYESVKGELDRKTDRYLDLGKELIFLTSQATDALVEIRQAMNEEYDGVT